MPRTPEFSELNSKLLNLFSCSMLISSYHCLCIRKFFSHSSLGPSESISFEGIGSVATGQTVGMDVISFPAVDILPKPPIETFQITGIFMSCALDHWMHASWGILFSTLPPVSPLCLICMQVRFHYHLIYFTDSDLFYSYSFRIHFLPTFVYLESRSLGKGAM